MTNRISVKVFPKAFQQEIPFRKFIKQTTNKKIL